MVQEQSGSSYFWAGVRGTLPLLTSVAPFGMLFGALGVSGGMPPEAAMAMSSLVFAGSAQFIGAQLIGGGAPAVVILLTTLVVNLRHVLYGLSVSPYLSALSPAWKWLLAYYMTDETYAVAITRFNQDGKQPNLHWFFLGSGLTMWSSWQVSSAVGILFGTHIPASWALDFAIPLTFIALLIPAVKDWAAVMAALVGGLAAVLFSWMPLKLGLVAAALVGIAVGMAVEQAVLRKRRLA